MRRTDDSVERLIDQKAFSSPEEAQLRDLVQASRGVGLSEESKREVYASVLQRRQTRPSHRFLVLRPAVVFTVLLVAAGATAAATIGQRWIARQTRPAPASRAIEPAAPPPRHVGPRVETTAPEAPVEIPAVAEPDNRKQRPGRVRARSEDPSQVVAAVKALRQQRDPERAARLLAEYLTTHPRGALAEEALALSIEAAAARRDPAASEFARRYLKEYPTGRFRRTAEAALPRR
jgi:hypothetical protein